MRKEEDVKPIVKEAQEVKKEIKQEPKKEIVKVESETETAGTAPVYSITHTGFPEDSQAQLIIRYAYDKYHDFEFIKMMECENGTFELTRKGDNGHAFGICQLNDRWHKDDIKGTAYLTDYKVAVDICYEHRKSGTRFYGYTNGNKACPKKVASRYIFS